jgi:hypothetical protein
MAIVTAIAMVATAAMSAMSSIQAGKAMEAKADAEAKAVEQQGRLRAANDRMDGALALARTNAIMAAQAAQIGASGFTSGIGSLGAALQLGSMRAGLETMQSYQTNSMLALAMSQQNALQIRWSGQVAKQQSKMKAIGTMVGAASSYGQAGGFSSEFYGTGTGP